MTDMGKGMDEAELQNVRDAERLAVAVNIRQMELVFTIFTSVFS